MLARLPPRGSVAPAVAAAAAPAAATAAQQRMSAVRDTAGGGGRSLPRGGIDGVVDDVPYRAAGDEVGLGDVAENFVDGDDQSYDQDELLRCCACHEMVREPALLLLPCLHACCAACFRSAPPPPAACRLCRVDVAAAAASATSESMARMSVLLGACSRAAAAAERQCTLCWQSGGSRTAAEATPPAEHECRQCGLRLCSHCAMWHRRFKRLHAVTAFGDASTEDAADDASRAAPSGGGGSRAVASASAAPAGMLPRRRWSSRPLAELRLASAKLAAMQQPRPPPLPQCIRHGLPCDTLCFTCERLACCKCVAPSANADLGDAGAADAGCAGHRVAAVASGEAAEYARRTRTSVEAAMSHVERCLSVALSMFGSSDSKVSSAKGSSAPATIADRSGNAAAAAAAAPLEAARAADLQRLQANKRLALERVARAHRTAERLLLEAYDALERETPARRSSVLMMSRQLQRARCYAELLGCADDASQWRQQQHPPGGGRRDRNDDEGDGDTEGRDKGNGPNDSVGPSTTAFLDQHGALLTCIRELLHRASAAAAPADGLVATTMDGSCCEGAAGTECDRLGGCRGEKTRENGDAIENLLLRQWLPPVIFPSTETEASSGTGAYCDRGVGDAPCDITVRGWIVGDVTGCYGADDVASAGDLGAESTPGGTAIDVTLAPPPPCFASPAIVTMDESFEEYTSLDDANGHDDGGSGCGGNGCVAADLSIARQQQPTLLTHCVLCEQLLDDPMLLACLHSCCRRCADAVADLSAPREANGYTAQKSFVHPRVACPICGVTCLASSLKPNRLASALLAAGTASQPRFSADLSAQSTTSHAPALHCDVCSDFGEKSEARLTCFVCKQCYCEPCELRHRALNARHSIGPVAAAAVIRQQRPLSYAAAAAQSCQLGGHDMFCIDCDSLRCHFCGKQCIERRHDLAAVDGQRMVSLAREAADRLHRSAAAVVALADQANVVPSGKGAVTAAASSDASLLLVANRTRTAESYCGLLLSSPDVALVLDQMSAVTSCLETLHREFEVRLSGIRRSSRSAGDHMPADG